MAQINSNNLRVEVSNGRVYIRVTEDTSKPGTREVLDEMKTFIDFLQKERIEIEEVMQRKVPGTVGIHEPDCVVLRLR